MKFSKIEGFLKKTSTDENELFFSIAQSGFPVYISSKLNPVFSLSCGNNKNKAVISTIPKSGTYLVGELLKHIGFELVKLNVRKNNIRDFRWADLNDFSNLGKTFPLHHLVQMILSGQVIAGHVEYDEYTKKSLLGFQKIFVYRNMRDALVSAMRHGEKWSVFSSDRENLRKREGPEKLLWYMNSTLCMNFLNTSNKVSGWFNDENTFKISYENLLGDYGIEKRNQSIIQLFKFLNCEKNKKQIEKILDATFSADTLTKSSKRTSNEKFWNDMVEKEFIKMGFKELNAKLGY